MNNKRVLCTLSAGVLSLSVLLGCPSTVNNPSSTPSVITPSGSVASVPPTVVSSTTPSTTASVTPGASVAPTACKNADAMKAFKFIKGKKWTYTIQNSAMAGLPDMSGIPAGLIPSLNMEMSYEILDVTDTTYKMKIVSMGQPMEITNNLCDPPSSGKTTGEAAEIKTEATEETITVPAGTFKCVKMTITDKTSGTVTTAWTSADVGMFVKQVSVGKDGTTTIELKSFQ